MTRSMILERKERRLMGAKVYFMIDMMEVGLARDEGVWRELISIGIGEAVSFILVGISSNITNSKKRNRDIIII